MSEKKRRGRPRLEKPRTREELNARARERVKRRGIKNVSLNGNVLDLIHKQQELLSKRIGTDLTLVQTLEITFKELAEKEDEV